MEGFIVYATYRNDGENARIHTFGRLENGESFQTIHDVKPYFFIEQQKTEQAKKLLEPTGIGVQYEITTLKNFAGQAVTKIITNNPKEVPELRKTLEQEGITCYEADVRFVNRYLMDHGIRGSMRIEGNYTKGAYVRRVYENPSITPSDAIPHLKTLAIDIETDRNAKSLYAMSLYGDDASQVLMVSDEPVEGAKHYPNEKAMLEAFINQIKEIDPDILTGWSVIDFDWRVIKNKLDQYNIPFILGRTEWECSMRTSSLFLQDSKADFPGRMVLDGIHILKNNLVKLPDYKLQTAAKHFLKESKTIEGVGMEKVLEIERQFREDKATLAKYNLKDSKLVYDILKNSKNLALLITRSMLTGMQLDRVSASIASFDQLYLPALRAQGFVAPCVQHVTKEQGGTGGFVMTSKPGLYDYVLVLDFKSLYPSIIRTFGIDPLTFKGVREGKKSSAEQVVLQNGAVFENTQAILPGLIEALWSARDKAKKEKDELASYAIKILMNSFYGVLASPQCRFFNLDISNAITKTGQYLIQLTAKEIEKHGYEVLYGDTDSVFVRSGATTLKNAETVGESLRALVNAFYEDYIPKQYHRKNKMELEFEKTFTKFWMPQIRGSDAGSKKRYAGLIMQDGELVMKFTGLEFVRRDWTAIAKAVQLGMLERVFKEEDYEGFLKKIVEEVKAGKHDEKLVYRKALTKPLDQYTKTTPPHVKAARKLKMLDSKLVDYVMTSDGPEPVQAIKHPLDYEHYIQKQIKPLADSILEAVDKSFDNVMKGSKQVTLGGF